MKKWYLSTPMNGKTEKEIQASLQRGIEWVKEKGDKSHSPYNPDNAAFNDKNEVHESLLRCSQKQLSQWMSAQEFYLSETGKF